MSLAGVNVTAVDDEAIASKITVGQSGAVGQGDIGTEQAPSAQLGHFATGRRRRAGPGMDPSTGFAGLRPLGRDRVQICLDQVG